MKEGYISRQIRLFNPLLSTLLYDDVSIELTCSSIIGGSPGFFVKHAGFVFLD